MGKLLEHESSTPKKRMFERPHKWLGRARRHWLDYRDRGLERVDEARRRRGFRPHRLKPVFGRPPRPLQRLEPQTPLVEHLEAGREIRGRACLLRAFAVEEHGQWTAGPCLGSPAYGTFPIRSRPVARGHVSPAYRTFAACLACPRMPRLMCPSRTRRLLSVLQQRTGASRPAPILV